MKSNGAVINHLVPMIYEGVLDPGIHDAMTFELCTLLGVIGLHGYVMSKESGATLFCLKQSGEGMNMEPPTKEYEQHFFPMDPLIPFTRGNHNWITDDVIPSSQIERHEFYQDFLIPSGSGRRLCSCIHESESLWFGLGFHRRRNQKPFGEPEHRLVNQLAPHLKCAGLLAAAHQDLVTQLTFSRASLDSVEDALIWVTPDGRIRNVNRAASDLLSKGTQLTDSFGKLQVRGRQYDHDLLIASVQQVARDRTSCRVQVGAAGDQRITIRLFPLPMDNLLSRGMSGGVVLLTIKSPKPQGNRLVALQQIFGLSLAEGRLAIALLEGLSLSEFASSRGLGMPTVRTQIKQVFAKTGTRRQAELVVLLGKML